MERLNDLVPVMQAFVKAVEALAEAEHRQADAQAVADLADIVIATRAGLARRLMQAGWSPPADVPEQLRNDLRLVDEAVSALDREAHGQAVT